MSDEQAEFIEVVRAAAQADPRNASLRVDLIELLLAGRPDEAARELDWLQADRLVDDRTITLLRARVVAARSRLGAGGRPDAAHRAPPAQPQYPPAQPKYPPQVERPHEPSQVERPQFPGDRTGSPAQLPGAGIDDGAGSPFWELERPGISLDDVAGMHEVKRHLHAAFLAPMRNPELARAFGKAPRGSLLMYGPPGCGKTLIARAIAGELGANFVHATLADLMGQVWGQTESAIHELFQTARFGRPCVLFIDEFDALGGRRSSGGSSSQFLRMVTSQLLMELDGVDSSNEGVYVLAATNRPWDIDPALRRPGRIDRTVLVLPPDQPAREAIIAGALRNRPAVEVDVVGIAARTDGFSGADLTFVVESAIEAAFMESIQTGRVRPITTHDLLQALQRVTPSTRQWFQEGRPTLEFGIDDGTHAQLRAYLRAQRL